MGNNIAYISWPHCEHNALLMNKFIEIRQSLNIDGSYESPITPFTNRCYVAGEISVGIHTLYINHHAVADHWLYQCRKFIKSNPQYGILPDEVRMTEMHLPM